MSRAVPGLLLASVLVAYPALEPSSLRGLFLFVGVVGAGVLLVAVLTGTPGVVGLGLLILFAEYAGSLVAAERLDWGAPVYAAALLLLGETACSLAGRHPATGEGPRSLVVAVLALASGLVVLGLAALPLPHGVLVQALGVGAASAVLLGLASLARARGG